MPRGAQSRAIVRVACMSGAPWSLNVPVEIRRRADVLVLKRAVARGESLTAADVTVQGRTLPGLESQYIGAVAELQGRLTRRPIPAGTALTADALAAALLIHRGQKVTLAASTSGIEVRAPGIALADASVNQRVRVQNLNSLKVVEGVADTEGVVRVRP
jgi:flagella basal body P-ring formation protein FlgA